ncbi:hypothetical protein CDIK_0971 [Cucumispora dikerogammari]|nr:hypothetical protein CDIK_0971 [Cucumispora dikerogammari]
MKYNPDTHFHVNKTRLEQPTLTTAPTTTSQINSNSSPTTYCLNTKALIKTQLTFHQKTYILDLFEKSKHNISIFKNNLQNIKLSDALDFLQEKDFLDEFATVYDGIKIEPSEYIAILQYLLIEVSPKLCGEVAFNLKTEGCIIEAMKKSKPFISKYLILINEKIDILTKNIIILKTKILNCKIRSVKRLNKKLLKNKMELRADIEEQRNIIRGLDNSGKENT